MKHVLTLPCLVLAACTPTPDGPDGAVPPAAQTWRSIATTHDRERLREWRTTWVKAVAKARAGGHASELDAEGALLEPDAALADVAPPPGDYRCRTIKIGAKSEGLLDYVAYPPFACRIGAGEATLGFVKLTGSQRQIGRLFPDSGRRMVFLGTLQLGDEQATLRYAHDADRDVAGLLERVGEGRWRIAFPSPAFESMLDVLELIPTEKLR